LAMLASAGCSPRDGRPLTVVGWGGSSQDAQRQAYWIPFVKGTGIGLREASWHGGVGAIRARIKSGNDSWDVVSVETEDLILGCREGLYEPMDWARLGGRDAFIDSAVSDCGVGSEEWTYLIGYDADRFPHGGPQTWADFWDVGRFPGKRGMRRTPKYTLEFALLADGVPPERVYPVLRTRAGVDRAFRKLDQLKPSIIWWTSIAQVPGLLTSGKVAMSVTSPGRLVIVNRTRHRHFRFSWYENIYAVDYWVVLKNSPRKPEAMELIRYMSLAENQERLAALIPTGVTNKDAARALPRRFRRDTPSDPENMTDALELDGDFWVEYGDQLTQRFNAWLAR
ncbi:MAG TPA: ABC transporter substrate-binding protein, partial [Rhodanobacteraceae bacterium]|nr:ABC transporter substrate-binding protein [Rhodanobacteraceae bacterium]